MPPVKTLAGLFFKGYSTTFIFGKGIMARGMWLHIGSVGNVHLVKPTSPDSNFQEFRGAAKGWSSKERDL